LALSAVRARTNDVRNTSESGRHSTRPYTPKTNGKAERFIQTALREWAYAQAYQAPIAEPKSSPFGSTDTTGIARTAA
jgi:Integrase core domain